MLPVNISRPLCAAFLTTLVMGGSLAPSLSAAEPDKKLPPVVKLPAVAKEITAKEAAELLAARGQISILDLRTAAEVKEQGRITGSKHLDFFRDDFATALKEHLKLDPAKPCLVYCALGGRARHAASRLAALGFTDILVLKDGYDAWKRAGLPVEVLK